MVAEKALAWTIQGRRRLLFVSYRTKEQKSLPALSSCPDTARKRLPCKHLRGRARRLRGRNGGDRYHSNRA